MKAVVVKGRQARVDRQRRIPDLPDDCILVKPFAVALNPTDWKQVKYGRAKDGCILGCDYAGIVEKVGSRVTSSWHIGDRIFGCGHGGNFANPDDGVFAEYAVVKAGLQMRIPNILTFQQAATIPLGAITVGQGLYQKALKLDLPTTTPEPKEVPVLIYGGATATGALGIQYAKQSGYTVITTCSPRHFEYVKGLGADFVVNYNDETAGTQIRKYTNNYLKYAWDTVSIKQSAQICADALSTSSQLNPVYGTTLPIKSPRDDINTVSTVMYTVFGKYFKFGDLDMSASQEDYNFGKRFFRLTEDLLANGCIAPHLQRVGGMGLNGVLQGLEDMEHGEVKGEKLVYLVNETP